MKIFGYTLPELKKSIVAFLGGLAFVLSAILETQADLIPPAALPWIQGFIGLAITFGVFKARNKTVPPVE